MTASAAPVLQELRALLAYDAVPAGCIAVAVTKPDLYPHLRVGEFAVVDPNDRDLSRGELYLVAWECPMPARSGREESALVQAFQRDHEGGNGASTAWWVGSMRNLLTPEARASLVAEGRWSQIGWSNGPYKPGRLEERVRGRVIGVLVPAFEEPRRLFGMGGPK